MYKLIALRFALPTVVILTVVAIAIIAVAFAANTQVLGTAWGHP